MNPPATHAPVPLAIPPMAVLPRKPKPLEPAIEANLEPKVEVAAQPELEPEPEPEFDGLDSDFFGLDMGVSIAEPVPAPQKVRCSSRESLKRWV